MKSEKLFDAMTHIREDVLSDADRRYARRRTLRRRVGSAVAAVLVVAILCGLLLNPAQEGPLSGLTLHGTAYAVGTADYPEMAPYPDESKLREDYQAYSALYNAWSEDIAAQRGERGYADGLDEFYAESIRVFLSDAKGENRVYSPLNVYMALAMLAEITDGESREQILDLLGHDSVESLRAQANMLWNANYRDDGATTSVLASSLWLNENVAFHQDTVNTLVKSYYSDVFQGTMGSVELNEALRSWLNERTGGLLSEQAEGLELSPESVLALATTVYFRAKWDGAFNEANTREKIFHSEDGDVTCDFMHSSSFSTYYWGKKFSATYLNMENAGGMYLILPDEGYSVDDLLSDKQVMELVLDKGDYDDCKYLKVNLSLPKFDVSSDLELKNGLKKMGVKDVFKETAADFSALTDLEPVWLQKVQHAARVVIDEEGCTAAAYTAMLICGSAEPPDDEVDFVLDRPFLFVLTGLDGQPLFTGVVNQPV